MYKSLDLTHAMSVCLVGICLLVPVFNTAHASTNLPESSSGEALTCPLYVQPENLTLSVSSPQAEPKGEKDDRPNLGIEISTPLPELSLTSVGLAVGQAPKQRSVFMPSQVKTKGKTKIAVYHLPPDEPLSWVCSYQFGVVTAYANATSRGAHCTVSEQRADALSAEVTAAILVCR